jgi:triacylglycerol lipase
LAHGAGGFDRIFGVLDYWYQIVEALRAGGAQVFVTDVSALTSTEVRGEQLIEQLEVISAVSGAPKFNLIGHSQGGLDIRYVAAVRPDLVASVTTIGTPNQGSDLATYVRSQVEPGTFSEEVLRYFGSAWGIIINLLAGTANPTDAIASLDSGTLDGVAQLNSRYPAALPVQRCGFGESVVDGIQYYSWSGTGLLTNAFDPSDFPLWLASFFSHEANDGIVGRCSSHLGYVIRDNYNYNHVDEANHVLGLVSWLAPDPRSIFRIHANRLKNAGL